jgi:hypothetical protein
LRGPARFGPVKWPPRRDALVACSTLGPVALRISAGDETEDRARRGIHYRSDAGCDIRGAEPNKNHSQSDLADSVIYVLC